MSNDAYFEAAMDNYEEEDDEYESENDNEDDEEEEYCPACGFPNCSGFCL
jgi:hypothetical protein